MATEDILTFDLEVNEQFELKKRSFLKKMATLFDPFGFLYCKSKSANTEIMDPWMKNYQQNYQQKMSWFEELILVPTIQVQRCFQLIKGK